MFAFSDTAGFETERLAFELTHERTANLNGVEGHNIGLDLVNEFMNADLKGTLTYKRVSHKQLSTISCTSISIWN